MWGLPHDDAFTSSRHGFTETFGVLSLRRDTGRRATDSHPVLVHIYVHTDRAGTTHSSAFTGLLFAATPRGFLQSWWVLAKFGSGEDP